MRPWRLTRRARVETEAALMALRSEGVRMERDIYPCASTVEALHAAGVSLGLSVHDHDESILRARVALALRAALRADEDARCEEARAREVASWPVGYEYRDLREASESSADAMREWPEVRQIALCGDDLRVYRVAVPRALWEVAR